METPPLPIVPVTDGRAAAIVALLAGCAALAAGLVAGALAAGLADAAIAAGLADAAIAAGLADAAIAAAVAGTGAGAAGMAGLRLGRAAQARADQLRLYRVSDELVQYRAFTRLLRAQGDRIADMTGDAALALASGLRDMDQRAGHLADALARGDGDPAAWRQQAVAIAAPVVDLVGRLQFQDVTRQQLGFLSRLSLILDDHMAELGHSLGDRRSLERTSRFKELFDRALDDTVMVSQRNDHHQANGGPELFEEAGPAIEMFGTEEEKR